MEPSWRFEIFQRKNNRSFNSNGIKYLSIGKALPKRRNIVISKGNNINNENIIIYNDINELISNELNNEEENFIIGGASLYNYFYPLADRMYLTLIDAEDKDADTYFPKINYNVWKQTTLAKNEDNGIKYKHVLFERVKNEQNNFKSKR